MSNSLVREFTLVLHNKTVICLCYFRMIDFQTRPQNHSPHSVLLEANPVTQLDCLILLFLEAELAQGLRCGPFLVEVILGSRQEVVGKIKWGEAT